MKLQHFTKIDGLKLESLNCSKDCVKNANDCKCQTRNLSMQHICIREEEE